jgi:putative endonuclease
MRLYSVYILASLSRRLYIGITNNLQRRVLQHRAHRADAFTARYRITRLVYFEQTADVAAAIAREKQLKGWRRARKVALIESVNAGWLDLAPSVIPSAARDLDCVPGRPAQVPRCARDDNAPTG